MPVESETSAGRFLGWHRKLWRLLFVVFCFEIGAFLLVFPWLEPWSNNWMADLVPWLAPVWENPYFRGALSGIGVLNVYISLREVLRMGSRRTS